MMESYLMMLYVTLDQESALKSFFLEHGWTFCKPDLTVITDKLGPAAFHPSTKKPLSETNVEQTVVENTRKRRVNTPLKAPVVKLAKVLSSTPATSVSTSAGTPKQSGTNRLSADSSKQSGTKQLWTGFIKEPGTQKLSTDVPQQSQKVSKRTRNKGTQEKLCEQSETSAFGESSTTEGSGGCSDKVKVKADKLNKENADDGDDDDSSPNDDDADDYLSDSSHVDPDSGLSVGDLIRDEDIKKEPLPVEDTTVKSQDKVFICKFCAKLFKSRATVTQHEKRHTNSCRYKCCERAHLIRHQCAVHGQKKRHHCKTCGKSFAINSDLMRHERREKGNLLYKCEKCEFRAENKFAIEQHQVKHTGDRNYRCHLCYAAFKFSSGLSRHQKVKHPHIKKSIWEAAYACPLLGNQPDENQKLVNLWFGRSMSKSLTSDNQYNCILCNQSLKTKSTLRRHLKTHLPTRINCSICNRFFSNSQEKDEHMASKHAEGFKCDMCGVKYKRKSDLKTHLLKHNAEMGSSAPGLFRCPYDYCKKVFFRLSNYKFHMNTHVGNKPYKCLHCEKAFSSAWSKNNHEKGCMNPSEYTCKICFRCFKQKSGLHNHTQAEHVKLQEGYTCKVCLSVFKYSTGLSRHMKEKHQTLDVGQQTEVVDDEMLQSTTKPRAMLLASKALVQSTSMILDDQNITTLVKDEQADSADEYESQTVASNPRESNVIRATEVVIESGKVYELDIDSNVVSEMVIEADENVEEGVDIGLHR